MPLLTPLHRSQSLNNFLTNWMRTTHTRLSMQESEVRKNSSNFFRLRSAMNWSVHTHPRCQCNKSYSMTRWCLLKIHADCRIEQKMSQRSGRALCSTKNSQTCHHNHATTRGTLCANEWMTHDTLVARKLLVTNDKRRVKLRVSNSLDRFSRHDYVQ